MTDANTRWKSDPFVRVKLVTLTEEWLAEHPARDEEAFGELVYDLLEERERVARLDAQVTELRESLAFYADPTTYLERGPGTPNSFGVYDTTECPICDDHGELARDTLAAVPALKSDD